MSVETGTTKFEPESRVVAGCSQVSIPDDVAARLTILLSGPLDWAFVFSVARRNAVLPLVSSNLLSRFGQLLPDEVKPLLKAEFHRRLQTNMYMTSRLLEIVRFLNENDIPVLPFKGPVLAIQAYGDPALRQYGDLDILVRPADFKRAVELLMADLEPVTAISWLNKTNWYISPKKDICFVDKERPLNVELHWKLSGSHFALPLELEHIWDSAEAVGVGGSTVNTLSFSHLVIYLCLHGSRHGWERLGWICDLNELIRSHGEIDWNSLEARAKRMGCQNVLGLGLRLVRDFFGLEDLPTTLQHIVDGHAFTEIVSDIRFRLFSPDELRMSLGDRYLYHLKMKERALDRWKLHLHYNAWHLRTIFKPNEMDRKLIDLPDWMHSLYYLVRPARLLWRSVIDARQARQDRIGSAR